MNSISHTIPEFLSNLPKDLFFIRQETILIFYFLILLIFAASKIGKQLSNWGLILVLVFDLYLYWLELINFQIPSLVFSNLLSVDNLGLICRILFSVSGILTLLIYHAEPENKSTAFPILILGVVIGLDLLVMSYHWAIAFLSLETVSIGSYLLVSLEKKQIRAEAGTRYLLFGAASSAILLYGITWFYGVSSSLELGANIPADPYNGLIFILIIGGILFKISGFPFHFWTPDTYQGSPGYLLPFLSYAPKIGGFIILLKFVHPLLNISPETLLPILSIAAIGSLMVGNWGALRQDHSLRLMAYSGIAQTGFVLAGLSCGKLGLEATVFYLVIYLPMNFLVFYILYLIGKKNDNYSINSLQGFGANNPLISILLLIGLVALAGLPPTVGFQGKLLIFSALWDSYSQSNNSIFIILLVTSGLFTLTSFYFYLKIPYYIFIKRNETKLSINLFIREKMLVMVLSAPLVLLFFMPQKLNNFIKLINLVY